MYKNKHKPGGETGGIVVLCPALKARWLEFEKKKQREKQKLKRGQINGLRKRHNSHTITRSIKR